MLLSRFFVVVIKKSGIMLYQQFFMGKKFIIKLFFWGLGGNSYMCMQLLFGGGGLGERVLYNLGYN